MRSIHGKRVQHHTHVRISGHAEAPPTPEGIEGDRWIRPLVARNYKEVCVVGIEPTDQRPRGYSPLPRTNSELTHRYDDPTRPVGSLPFQGSAVADFRLDLPETAHDERTDERKVRESNPQGREARLFSRQVPSPIGLTFRKRKEWGSNPQGREPRHFSRVVPSPTVGLPFRRSGLSPEHTGSLPGLWPPPGDVVILSGRPRSRSPAISDRTG